MSRSNNSVPSPIVIRFGDMIGFTGRRTYRVDAIDRDNNTATLRNVTDNTLTTFDLDWLTDSVATRTNGIHVYMGKPAVWLPILPGHVWYGFGYAVPVDGGYAYDDADNVICDVNNNPVTLKDHDHDKWMLYMANPAKYYRFGGKK